MAVKKKRNTKPKTIDKMLCRRFAQEYVLDFNKTQAAIRCGIPKRGAATQGGRLFKYVETQSEIQRLLEKKARESDISVDKVLRELAIIGLSSVENYRLGEDGWVERAPDADPSVMRAVSSITIAETKHGTRTTFKLWNKNNALELIGRHLAMFVDRNEITGKDGEPLKTQVIKIGDKEIAF